MYSVAFEIVGSFSVQAGAAEASLGVGERLVTHLIMFFTACDWRLRVARRLGAERYGFVDSIILQE